MRTRSRCGLRKQARLLALCAAFGLIGVGVAQTGFADVGAATPPVVVSTPAQQTPAAKPAATSAAPADIAPVAAPAPAAPAATAPTPAKAYFATVNGTGVTRDVFLTKLEQTYGLDVMNEIIADILINQAAVSNGIVISDDAVLAEEDKAKAQFQTGDEFTQALANYHLDLTAYRHQVWMRLVLEQLGAPNTPTEDQLKAYYDENKSRYEQPEEVDVRHILVKTEDEGNAVLAELAKGGDFAKLAQQYSIDTGSKDNGGDIGYASRGQLVAEFEDVAFALKPGETSGLVKTTYGYHIIRLIDHRAAQPTDYAAARESVIKDWKTDNTMPAADVMAQLKRQSYIKIAVPFYSSLENDPTAAKPSVGQPAAPTDAPAAAPTAPAAAPAGTTASGTSTTVDR